MKVKRYISVFVILAACLLLQGDSVYSQWSDPTTDLVEAQTAIRAHHYRELRNAIDNKRVLCGLAPADWENPSLIEGRTAIRGKHLEQLREAITDVYNLPPARPLPFTGFTDPVISSPGTPVRLVHLTELRQAYESVTCCGDTVCNGTEDSSNCSQDCLCSYGNWTDTGLGCGVGTCDDYEIQVSATDLNGTPGCDTKFDCQVNYNQCCNYQGWQDIGCGVGDCGYIGTMYQENYPAELGCPIQKQCVDLHSDCCNYTGYYVWQGCGQGDCEPNQFYVGRYASKAGCPSDPSGFCFTFEFFNCCQYDYTWVDVGCGLSGSTVSCSPDMMLQTQTPAVTDSTCLVKEQCAPSDVCCAYSPFVQQACGLSGCAENQVLEISTPANPSSNCQPLERCTDANDFCCGYSGYVNQTCGQVGSTVTCAGNQILQVNTPLNGVSVDCPVMEQCVTDEATCCNYSGYVNQSCGGIGSTMTCRTDQILRVDTPLNGVSVDCPVRETCLTDVATCCNYSGIVSQGCGGVGSTITCPGDSILLVNTPQNGVSADCPIYEECAQNVSTCCNYTGYQDQGCGQVGSTMTCLGDQILRVNTPQTGVSASCPLLEQCVTNQATCCNYSGYQDNGCGQNGATMNCSGDQILMVNTPLNGVNAQCPLLERCDDAADLCCNYSAWQNGACGSVGTFANCAGDQYLRSRIPGNPGPDCPLIEECVTDTPSCCNYTGYVNQGCGLAGSTVTCLGDQILQVDTPQGGVSAGCPLHEQCVTDTATCCNYSGLQNQTCGGVGSTVTCRNDQILQVNTPQAGVNPQCPLIEQCFTNSATCCNYTGYIAQGCGMAGSTVSCLGNQVLRVNTPQNGVNVDCPLLETCTTDVATCCNYTGYVNQGCGLSGSTVTCSGDKILQVNTPQNGVNAQCPLLEQCVTNLATCCNYTGLQNIGCGLTGSTITCTTDKMLKRNTPQNGVSVGCPLIEQCVTDLATCCNYTGYQDIGCGVSGTIQSCAGNQMLQRNTPQNGINAGCPLLEQCITNVSLCCNYSGFNNIDCGVAGNSVSCLGNQMLQVNTPLNGVNAGCPLLEQCVSDDITCCGYGGLQEAGCSPLGSCPPGHMLSQNVPSNINPECPIIDQCNYNSICCNYGSDQAKSFTCGQGGCAANQLMVVQTASGCPEIQTGCVDDVSCYECTVGNTTGCTTTEGCPGTQDCPNGLLTACVQSNLTCTPGSEQACVTIGGVPSVQVCNSCGNGWGPCTCDFGDELVCVTTSNCPGVRTCANGAWESCIPTQPICVPGTKLTCTTPNGLQGTKSCSTCGDNYGVCGCTPGSTIACTMQNNCSGKRTCLSDGSDWGSCVQTDLFCN